MIPAKSAFAETIIACEIAVVEGEYRCLFRPSSGRLLQGIEGCLEVELSGRRLCRLAAWQSGALYAGAVDRARSGVRSIPALSRFRRERSCGRQPGRRSNQVISAAELQDERRGNRSCSIPRGGASSISVADVGFFIAPCESLAPAQLNSRCKRSQAWFGRRGGWRPNCLFLRDRVF
jgi:hypothetical protein